MQLSACSGTFNIFMFDTVQLYNRTTIRRHKEHEQRVSAEGGDKPEADRDGGTGAVEGAAQGQAGGVRLEGRAEGPLQRCDPRKGPGARHRGGPGHRGHPQRPSTCTGQREERASPENQSISGSTCNFVKQTNPLTFFSSSNSL